MDDYVVDPPLEINEPDTGSEGGVKPADAADPASALRPPPDTLSYKTPYRSAERFVDSLRDRLGRVTLVRWRGDFYRWTTSP